MAGREMEKHNMANKQTQKKRADIVEFITFFCKAL